MELETRRLLLRAPRPEDAAAYTAIHNSAFVLRYNAMAPAAPERMERKFREPEYREKAVFLVEKITGRLLGAIFIEEDDLRFGVNSRSLSYFINEADSRRGYMKEAMSALIDRLFAEEKLACLSARVFAPNTPSRALLKSLGFQENGTVPHCVKGYTGEIFDDVIHTLFPDKAQ